MHEIVDLRSDTTTRPTPSMWKAIANAKVGDDVYGDDPTVNELEKKAAAMLGKEAALFVPSGTMGNLSAIISHCVCGDEAIIGSRSHIFVDEAGGIAALAGVNPHTIPNQPDGTLKLEDISAAFRMEDIHNPISKMVAIENTMLEMGGVPLTYEYTQQVGELAHSLGLVLHIDGARFFNASVALSTPAHQLAAPADSITFCLSKGLCAPAGSMLCGTERFIYRARRARKQLGGGMRQIGILAAAGIVALEENVERLADDHRRMKVLSSGIKQIPGLNVDSCYPTPTNIAYFSISPDVPFNGDALVEKLKAHDILCNTSGVRRFRLVTHYWIDDDDIDKTLTVLNTIMRQS